MRSPSGEWEWRVFGEDQAVQTEQEKIRRHCCEEDEWAGIPTHPPCLRGKRGCEGGERRLPRRIAAEPFPLPHSINREYQQSVRPHRLQARLPSSSICTLRSSRECPRSRASSIFNTYMLLFLLNSGIEAAPSSSLLAVPIRAIGQLQPGPAPRCPEDMISGLLQLLVAALGRRSPTMIGHRHRSHQAEEGRRQRSNRHAARP